MKIRFEVPLHQEEPFDYHDHTGKACLVTVEVPAKALTPRLRRMIRVRSKGYAIDVYIHRQTLDHPNSTFVVEPMVYRIRAKEPTFESFLESLEADEAALQKAVKSFRAGVVEEIRSSLKDANRYGRRSPYLLMDPDPDNRDFAFREHRN